VKSRKNRVFCEGGHWFAPKVVPKIPEIMLYAKPTFHIMVIGEPFHRGVVLVCPRHYRQVNRQTRQTFFRRRPEPYFTFANLYDPVNKVRGMCDLKTGAIYLDAQTASDPLEPEHLIYTINHEYLHYILGRDLGWAAAGQLDLLHRRPLQCLNGNTLQCWLLTRIAESSNTPGAL